MTDNMSPVTSETATTSHSTATLSTASGSGLVRWWTGVAVALVVCLPLGWLLSYAAALVAFLGLFFFSLFGLIIGAIMYRFGVTVRPIPKIHLRVGAGLVVALCWSLSMGIEVHDFASDKASYAVTKVEPLPEGKSPEQVRDDIARYVRETLERDYGGSGLLGYAKWILLSSEMQYQPVTMKQPIVLKSIQYRWWWVIRVVLSIILLSFSVYAQISPLSGLTDPAGASVQAAASVGERHDA